MSLAYFIFLFLHRKDAMYAQSLLISVNKVNIIIGTFVFKLNYTATVYAGPILKTVQI